MHGHVAHKVILPNGTWATLMARTGGENLVIVRMYLQEPDGTYRSFRLPTSDPAALEVIDHLRQQNPRFLFES